MKNNNVTNVISRFVYKKTYEIYDEIKELFEEYKNIVVPEQLRLGGHEHFRIKEIEKEILSLIDQDERVLLIQDVSLLGRNIGMEAVLLGFEDIVLRALDNEKASTQQNGTGYNIGMYAAMYKHSN